MKSGPFNISFGVPYAGWLPVTIQSGEFTLHFEASDVPEDPIGQLIDALRQVLHGQDGEVWWHLEPAGYYLYLTPYNDECILSITYSDGMRPEPGTEIFKLQTMLLDVLACIWRALRQFETQNYKEPVWPQFRSQRFKLVTETLEKKLGGKIV